MEHRWRRRGIISSAHSLANARPRIASQSEMWWTVAALGAVVAWFEWAYRKSRNSPASGKDLPASPSLENLEPPECAPPDEAADKEPIGR